MKQRNSLVSNSSSTSFILVGIPIDPKQLKGSDIKNGIWVIGQDFGEDGRDVFQIKEIAQLRFIQDYPKYFRLFSYAKVKFDDSLKGIEIPGMIAVGGTATINSTSDTQSLVENYLPDYINQMKKKKQQLIKDVEEKARKEVLEKYGVKIQ